jgi:hypothetical protein
MSERKFFRQAEWEFWFPPGVENQMDLESDSVQLIELSECRFWPFGRPGVTGVSTIEMGYEKPPPNSSGEPQQELAGFELGSLPRW